MPPPIDSIGNVMRNKGPPYLPSTWAIGGIPKLRIDVPITAVFLLLYVVAAALHMVIFQLDRRRGHIFRISLLLFAFCMARTVTCVLRIASISRPQNIRLSIAASVLVSAGILLIYLVNLVFAQRLVRAMHPRFGWSPALSHILHSIYVLIGLTLAIVITATVQSFYTLRPRTRQIDRDLQLYAATFLTVISFLPIPMILVSLVIPAKSPRQQFGAGGFWAKVSVLLAGSAIVCLGAAFRCGTAWRRPVPHSKPLPGYYSRACFYVFVFVVEILIIYLYAVARVDLRFHVPDGASRRSGYGEQSGSKNQGKAVKMEGNGSELGDRVDKC